MSGDCCEGCGEVGCVRKVRGLWRGECVEVSELRECEW